MCRKQIVSRTLALIVGVQMLAPGGARAISNVDVSPTQVSVGAGSTVNLTWTAVDGKCEIRSDQGEFQAAIAPFQLLGTVGTVLSRGAPDVHTEIFSETLTVPANVVTQAQALGNTAVLYTRSFTVKAIPELCEGLSFSDFKPKSAVVKLNLVPAPPGPVTPVTSSPSSGLPPPTPFSSCAVASVSPAPSSQRVTVGSSPVLNVRWSASILPGVPANVAVSSPTGTFRTPDFQILGTSSAGSIAGRTGGAGLVIPETFRVPREIIYTAFKRGVTRIVYSRSFTGGTCTVTGELALDLAGGAAGTFALRRLELLFEGGARSTVVSAGSALRARARIAYDGSGILRGRWILAGPVAAGTEQYRTLEIVQRTLAGGAEVVLESPPLPTGLGGLFFVGFQPEAPALDVRAPTIRYYVGASASPGPPASPAAKVVIPVREPGEGAAVKPGLVFAWEPVPGSLAYQVEIYAAAAVSSASEALVLEPTASTGYVAGLIVPGSESKAALSQLTLGRLKPGQTHRWRVVSIGKGGAVLGESALRGIAVP